MHKTVISALVLSVIAYFVYRYLAQKYARLGLILSFDGTGYATFAAGSEYNVKLTRFEMEIKTTSPTGILMYAKAEDDDYFVADLLDGHVVFEADMGSGPIRIKSPIVVNDGRWHKVLVDRFEKKVNLRVDDDYRTDTSQTANIHVSRPAIVYVGGNALGEHEKFKGCMRNIRFNERFDIEYDFNAGGVTLGCQ